MKTYSLTPSLHGVLSDDYLYFEGAARPEEYFLLRDGGAVSEESVLQMERYFNDIYTLFLRKLALFASGSDANDEENLKLQALLQEMIKVRNLIENAEKADIMGE
jgi:hypothetical protein